MVNKTNNRMTTAGYVTQLVQLDDEKTSIPIISMESTSNIFFKTELTQKLYKSIHQSYNITHGYRCISSTN
jgi:hypothetical protein